MLCGLMPPWIMPASCVLSRAWAKRQLKVEAGRLGGLASGESRKTKQNEASLEADEQKKSKVKESPIIPLKKTYGEFKNVSLSEEEYKKRESKFGAQGAVDWIEEVSIAKASKGYKSKSDYATILSWERRRQKQTLPEKPIGKKYEVVN